MKLKRSELIKRLEAGGFAYVDSSRVVWTQSPIVTWEVIDADDHVVLSQNQSFVGSKARLAELALATGFDFMGEHDLLARLRTLETLARALALSIEQIAKEIEKKAARQ